jgi:hypothetical protein
MSFNFKKFNRNKILLIGTLVAIFSLSFYFLNPMKPNKALSFHGVSLGMDMKEVEYILGSPELAWEEIKSTGKVSSKDSSDVIYMVLPVDEDKVKKSKNQFYDFFYWSYVKSGEDLMITFNQNKVVKSISCNSSSNLNVCEIYGLKLNDTEESVINRLGSPSSSSINNGYKFLEFKELNLRANLKEKKLVSVIFEEIH